jgi:lipoprotein NlpI
MQTAKEQYANAATLYRRALKLRLATQAPNEPEIRDIYAQLGSLHSRMGDLQQAEWDLEHACRGNNDDDIARRLWLVKTRLGKWEEADRFLRRYAARHETKPRDQWSQQLTCYLLGETTEDDLLGAVNGSDDEAGSQRRSQACFYIASKQLAEGRQDEASSMLRYCLDTDGASLALQRDARATLDRLVETARLTNVNTDNEFPQR